MADLDLLTLTEAAKLIPGADADTLKRRARQGKLVTYRPGKAYLTTRADVEAMIQQCRVAPKARDCGSGRRVAIAPAESPTNRLGLSSTVLAKSELAAARATLRAQKKPSANI